MGTILQQPIYHIYRPFQIMLIIFDHISSKLCTLNKKKNLVVSIYTTRDQIEDRVTDQRTGTKSEEVKKKKKIMKRSRQPMWSMGHQQLYRY